MFKIPFDPGSGIEWDLKKIQLTLKPGRYYLNGLYITCTGLTLVETTDRLDIRGDGLPAPRFKRART